VSAYSTGVAFRRRVDSREPERCHRLLSMPQAFQ
jgi:hypothetical protein